ncbi:MAG: type II secretion system F family protein [Planctomycetota bacterium]
MTPPDQEPVDPAGQEPVTSDRVASFRFSAQHINPDAVSPVPPDEAVTGSIDAGDPDTAQATLAALQLRVLSLEPTEAQGRAKPVRGGDFLAFNQQLAYMTEAGMPMEQGLRLIAQDLKGGRLSGTIEQVANELKAGKSLPDAFASHKGAFPPLYGAVLEAGVRSGNLPGVLMGLGSHLEMMQRLRAAIWRAVAYPLIVFFGVLIMLGVLGFWLVPQFSNLFEDFDVALPWLTYFIMDAATYMPLIVIGLVVLSIVLVGGLSALRAAGKEQLVFDKLLWVPLIGPAIGRNLLSRWCDAMALGLNAGLDLPGALSMASQTLCSGPLERDTDTMIASLQSGKPITQSTGLRFVPAAVPASIELAAQADDLPAMLKNLSTMYQQQAEARVAALQLILGPVLLVFTAVLIGIVISALFYPLILLMESLM